VIGAAADRDGRFEITDLAPGEYFVAAWEDVDPEMLGDPAFRARFQNDAVRVTLDEGGSASADVKVISRERLGG
jgi:hypothetical protein